MVARLNSEEVPFLAHELEFLQLPFIRSAIVVSRVTQSLLIDVRVEIWLKTIREYFSREWR